MPIYRDRHGNQVPACEALINGSVRDGYSTAMAPGERAHFDVNFVDDARGKAVFLTDTKADAEIRREVDRQHAAHDHKFSFMGDNAPKFDRERAAMLVRNRDAAMTPTVSAAMAAARYEAPSATFLTGQSDGKSTVHDASAVDAIRRARYA